MSKTLINLAVLLSSFSLALIAIRLGPISKKYRLEEACLRYSATENLTLKRESEENRDKRIILESKKRNDRIRNIAGLNKNVVPYYYCRDLLDWMNN